MSTPRDDSSSNAFRWLVRVYYEDTDAGGVVYYANFLKFFERCRTEWLRAVGVEQQALVRENGVVFVVAALSAEYRRPARLDDELAIDAVVAAAGRASLVFEQRAWRGDELVCSGRVKIACVDSTSFAPVRIPACILDVLPG